MIPMLRVLCLEVLACLDQRSHAVEKINGLNPLL